MQKRLQSTDLIPSQEPLLEGLAKKMSSIRKAGVQSTADLRTALKTKKSLASLAESSGLDTSYLQLLRRTINGFFPKPRPLKDIDWLDKKTLKGLNKAGIKDTRKLFEEASGGAAKLAGRTGADRNALLEFVKISDLCRIQWVSPTFARVLVAAGCDNAAAVAAADSEALYNAISAANEDAKFYKGKIGLRDVRRLVAAAAYVP
ncbi:MAG: DUF4332 domain-containing protein [Pseudomonadota bacterium]